MTASSDTALDAVCAAIGYTFRDRALLRTALTHRSFTSELPQGTRTPKSELTAHASLGQDNERLEFLGDSILNFVIAELLWLRMPDVAEGVLSRVRAAVVSEPSLAQTATQLGLGAALRLGRGEDRSGGRARASLLADAMEAVFAAVYLESGFDAAREVIARVLASRVEFACAQGSDDPKSTLQEIVQGRFRITPRYDLVASTGPDHDRRHEVELRAGDVVTARGIGRSRKDAEQSAARAALEILAKQDEAGASAGASVVDVSEKPVRLGAGGDDE